MIVIYCVRLTTDIAYRDNYIIIHIYNITTLIYPNTCVLYMLKNMFKSYQKGPVSDRIELSLNFPCTLSLYT